jgi:hypothetical protein
LSSGESDATWVYGKRVLPGAPAPTGSDGHGNGHAADWFSLTLCHAHRGDAAKAKDYYDRAVQWMQEQQGKLSPHESQELTAFRAKADAELAKLPKP